MKISLDENVTKGLLTLSIPTIFYDEKRIQPASFGYIYIITGRKNSKITAHTGPKLVAFKDHLGRGYIIEYSIKFNKTSAAYFHPNETYCIDLDTNGNIAALNTPCFITARKYIELQAGDKTRFKIIIKLISNTSITIIPSEEGYRHSPSERPFKVEFNPEKINLKPGEQAEITVTIKAIDKGMGIAYIRPWAVTSEGYGIGIGPIIQDSLLVIVTP